MSAGTHIFQALLLGLALLFSLRLLRFIFWPTAYAEARAMVLREEEPEMPHDVAYQEARFQLHREAPMNVALAGTCWGLLGFLLGLAGPHL
jgi:hypothetical protein